MKEVDNEVQNNEDGLGYGFENPDAEPLKYRTRAERKAREEKNRKEANIVYENYKEYETMYKYVKNISRLESYFIKTPEGRSEYLDNIVSLLQAAEKYMKGKKSVRSSNDGKDRFDNALDVLGVMYKYIPGGDV